MTSNSNIAESASSQASQISTVGNAILVYCGLIVAGTLALIASDRMDILSEPAAFAVIACLISSLLSGTLTIYSVMQAHNLARRATRYKTGLDQDEKRIESARFGAVASALASYILAILSAACVAFVAIVITMHRPPKAEIKAEMTTVVVTGEGYYFTAKTSGPADIQIQLPDPQSAPHTKPRYKQ